MQFENRIELVACKSANIQSTFLIIGLSQDDMNHFNCRICGLRLLGDNQRLKSLY